MEKLDAESLHEFGIEITERGEIEKKKSILNNENTYLLSCKDFSGIYTLTRIVNFKLLEINIILSGKSEQTNFRTHQSRFGAALAQIPFRHLSCYFHSNHVRRLVGNRIRHLTVDTALPLAGNSSGR